MQTAAQAAEQAAAAETVQQTWVTIATAALSAQRSAHVADDQGRHAAAEAIYKTVIGIQIRVVAGLKLKSTDNIVEQLFAA